MRRPYVLRVSRDMNGALYVSTLIAVAFGVLPGLCIVSGSVHHGVQPPWAGGSDDGISDDLDHYLKCDVCPSASVGPLLPLPCKSKDGLGHTSTKQVGRERHPRLCRTYSTAAF